MFFDFLFEFLCFGFFLVFRKGGGVFRLGSRKGRGRGRQIDQDVADGAFFLRENQRVGSGFGGIGGVGFEFGLGLVIEFLNRFVGGNGGRLLGLLDQRVGGGGFLFGFGVAGVDGRR